MTYTIKSLCSDPVMYWANDFLSNDECEALIALAKPRLEKSSVINADTGAVDVTDYRQSRTMFFTKGEDTLISTIEYRISMLTGFGLEKGENLQVVKYGVGEYYKPHWDYFPPEQKGSEVHMKRGGQRLMTVLMYLNNVAEGGETYFPELGIKVVPRKGSAICWWNCYQNGVVIPDTLHGGEPVRMGEKWIMTKWLHEGVYT